MDKRTKHGKQHHAYKHGKYATPEYREKQRKRNAYRAAWIAKARAAGYPY